VEETRQTLQKRNFASKTGRAGQDDGNSAFATSTEAADYSCRVLPDNQQTRQRSEHFLLSASSSFRYYSPVSLRRLAPRGAFTLVELLVVVAILSTLMVLAIPPFINRKSADEITNAAYSIKAVLEQARTYAKANNTYTWVGFYEEDATAASPTNAAPPYPGKGRVVLATVASSDGTTNCQDSASSTANRIPLVASKIHQLGRLVKIDNIHLTDIGGPSSTASPAGTSVDDRPDFPYTWGAPDDYQNRISSDDVHAPFNQSLYPFVAQGYTFYKTIRFSPRGEANINSTYNLRRLGEIGLRPTHGTIVDTNSTNVAAIQFSGITGDVKVYRK
jgi:prepilin-type N-terminal cleavage/methylation domain-containing protein